ncbi:extracellular solute-binding protein [Eubacteriales bacterium OttesenSCG-928-N13]|nr:extracellular solute-binding protein [Eubacteriales bacterium OttesenSCG-928-N13]
MKKTLALLLTLALCLSMGTFALADGVTLKTVSTFAGTDPATPQYNAILAEYEQESGNKVEDASATSDEAWKAGVLNDFAAGNEADIMFYFAATADSEPILDKVVSIQEINEAYPELNLTVNELLTEADGNVYAIPVRSFWEGLFVNKDLFDQFDLELPTDWAKLELAVATFKENGIVPIAVSLSDIPHYILEFCILSAGPASEHQAKPLSGEAVPESWIKGMEVLRKLNEMGAFAEDVNATTETITSQLFRDKKAAMQLDGSWFANGLAQENWDNTVVVPFPATEDDADPTAIIGGTSMGFYMTRKAWDDPAKRDAAVQLLAKLTSDDSVERMGFVFGGELLKSAKRMVGEAKAMCTPIQDMIDTEVRNYWFSQAPALADGTADATEVMTKVVNDGAYK